MSSAVTATHEMTALPMRRAYPYHVKDRPEMIRIVVETVELDPDLADERFGFPGSFSAPGRPAPLNERCRLEQPPRCDIRDT